MGEKSHAPGNWATDCDTNGRAYGVSAKNADGYRVPVVVWRGIAKPSSAEGQANARLIAASPDLLVAATLAEDIIDDFLGHLSPDEQVASAEDPKAATALKALRAAIAKATGASE